MGRPPGSASSLFLGGKAAAGALEAAAHLEIWARLTRREKGGEVAGDHSPRPSPGCFTTWGNAGESAAELAHSEVRSL